MKKNDDRYLVEQNKEFLTIYNTLPNIKKPFSKKKLCKTAETYATTQ